MCDATFKLIPQILLQKKHMKAKIMKLAMQPSSFLHVPPDSSLLGPNSLNALFQTHSIYFRSLI
jgi:hypothetical protein